MQTGLEQRDDDHLDMVLAIMGECEHGRGWSKLFRMGRGHTDMTATFKALENAGDLTKGLHGILKKNIPRLGSLQDYIDCQSQIARCKTSAEWLLE